MIPPYTTVFGHSCRPYTSRGTVFPPITSVDTKPTIIHLKNEILASPLERLYAGNIVEDDMIRCDLPVIQFAGLGVVNGVMGGPVFKESGVLVGLYMFHKDGLQYICPTPFLERFVRRLIDLCKQVSTSARGKREISAPHKASHKTKKRADFSGTSQSSRKAMGSTVGGIRRIRAELIPKDIGEQCRDKVVKDTCDKKQAEVDRNMIKEVTNQVSYPRVNLLRVGHNGLTHGQSPYSPDDLLKNPRASVNSLDFHALQQNLLLVNTNMGDVMVWDLVTREGIALRNFKVWEFCACSTSAQASPWIRFNNEGTLNAVFIRDDVARLLRLGSTTIRVFPACSTTIEAAIAVPATIGMNSDNRTNRSLIESNKWKIWKLCEASGQSKGHLLWLPDSISAMRATRLIFANSGLVTLALASNVVHKFWMWPRNDGNSRAPSVTILAFHLQENDIIDTRIEDLSTQVYGVRIDEVRDQCKFRAVNPLSDTFVQFHQDETLLLAVHETQIAIHKAST